MPGIVHADIEAVLVGYLAAALAARPEPHAAGVEVDHKVPGPGEEFPRRLVVVRDDGGPSLGDVRAVARVGVQVWAEDEATVSDLANLVSALVGASVNVGPIRRAEASRPYSVDDIADRPKQYFTGELVVRGVSL